MKIRMARVNGALVLALGCGFCMPAAAQGQRSTVLEEIVVTAQKRAESMQVVPVALTAIGGQTIENNQIVNLQDIKGLVPNLYIEEALGSETTPKAFMRGIGVDNQVFSFDTPIGFYVDGVYFARVTGALVDMFDVERIEVLRGPQSVLYGRNSSVGAIRTITKTPNLESYELFADATVGSEDRRNASVSVNLPISEDKAGLRVSLSTRNADGWMTDLTTGEDYQSEAVDSGRFTLQLAPTENLDVFLRGDFMNDDSRVRRGSNFMINPDNDIYTFERSSEANLISTTEVWGTSLTVVWDHAGWDFTSITAYRELTYRNADDVDGRADVRSFEVDRQDLDESQFSQEFTFSGTSIGGSNASWVAGAYYFEEDNDFYWALRIFAPPTLQNFKQDTETSAVYGQITWPLTEKLSLNTGARYTSEEKTIHAIQFMPDGTLNTGFAFDDTIDTSKTTWSASLNYQLNEDVMIYGSAATGFRSGGFNGSARDQASILSGSFGIEESSSIELGAKGDYLDGRLRVNAAYFFADYDDLQLAITQSDGTITSTNVQADVHGLELEVMARATENLDLSLTLGTMSDDIKNSDRELKNTPDLNYRLAIDYRIPLNVSGAFSVGADYSWNDGSFNDTNNAEFTHTGTYSYLNARVRWQSPEDRWAVTLSGNNLQDEFVNIHTFNIAGGFISSVHFTNTPRNWALNLRYRY